MVARPIEARLTARLLGVGSVVLALVGVSSVLLTHRVLDASDTDAARAGATTLRDALRYEIDAEGDAPSVALGEVVAEAEAKGDRVAVRWHGTVAGHGTMLDPGTCTTLDEGGKRWRACSAGDGELAATASVPIDAHRAAVMGLAKAMAVVIALALFVLAFAIRRALAGPVSEIHALVDWTGRVTDTTERPPPPPARTREIEQLESAFDDLVRRLLDGIARERTITAHIAHELRTPLTTMFAELDALGTSEAAERIRADAKRVRDVVDAILVLSERGSPRPNAVVNVADLARDLAPEGASVDAPDEALVDGDERLIALAVRNLVENASKYAGSARELRVSRDDSTVEVAVIDRGPGMPDEARGKMFDRWWRGAADGEGRGLGLALVRAVAEKHGGEARAKPGPGGSGLEVSMTLRPLVAWHDSR